jgi:hypothetical protein
MTVKELVKKFLAAYGNQNDVSVITRVATGTCAAPAAIIQFLCLFL